MVDLEKPYHEGFLKIRREDRRGNVLKSEKRRYVALYLQSLTLTYYQDKDTTSQLGSIDLRYGKIRRSSEIGKDKFVIEDSSSDKTFRMRDSVNASNVAEWYTTIDNIIKGIKGPADYAVNQRNIQELDACYRVGGYRMDEVTQIVEFEIKCQVEFCWEGRESQKQISRWSTWRSFEEFKSLDNQLRQSLDRQMDQIDFPRERKRDVIFGSKSKSLQETRSHQLNDYLVAIVAIPNVAEFGKSLSGNMDLKMFLKYYVGFGYDVDDPGEDMETLHEPVEVPIKSRQMEGSSNRIHGVSKYHHMERNCDMIQGFEAESLNDYILDSVSKAVDGDITIIHEFKQMTRLFGKGSKSSLDYLTWVTDTFGDEFCQSIGYDIARLVPDVDQRKSLIYQLDLRSKSFEASSPPQENQRNNQNSKTLDSHQNNLPPNSSSSKPLQAFFRIDDFSSIEVVTNPIEAKNLHQKILDLVYFQVHQDSDRVEDFQDQTKCFGRGELTALEYYSWLQGALGQAFSSKLVMQMLRLLPDSTKRRELYSALEIASRRAELRRKSRSKEFFSETKKDTSSAHLGNSEQSVEFNNKDNNDQGVVLESTTLDSKPSTQPSTTQPSTTQPSTVHVAQPSTIHVTPPSTIHVNEKSTRPLSKRNITIPESQIVTEVTSKPLVSRRSKKSQPIHAHSNRSNQNQEVQQSRSKSHSGIPGILDFSGSSSSVAMQRTREDRSEESERFLEKKSEVAVEPEQHPPQEEVNPVLERLRKQGAVNFFAPRY